jgi:argininosuccinate lyase
VAHLWSGRFEGEPDAGVFAFGASFRFDRRLFEDDVAGSRAWVRALARAGVLTADDAVALDAALTGLLADSAAPGFFDAADEDVHAFVERKLVERVGDAGKRLHTGRSRNEQVALDLRLYLRRRSLPRVRAALVALIAACRHQAVAAGDALMPAYTHLRRAQPVLVSHYWLAHAAALRRDAERLAAVATEADALPSGSGAVAGSAYAIDVEALARDLGFSRVVANSLDATSDRDFVASFLFAVALASVHLSRLGEDIIIFGSEEFGFFDLDDRVATGSSLMPQKKNPDPLELVRGKTGRTVGHLAGWLTTMKGLPSGYNKDLQEDKEAVFDAEDTLAGTLAAMTTVVATLRVRTAATTAAAGGFMLATDVADFLVARGLPFREAHEVVGTMVRVLSASHRTFDDLAPDEWRAFSPLFDDTVGEAITARGSVEARQTPQSTRPEAVAAALAELTGWLENQPETTGRDHG